jgi:ferrous iron transport protein A
MRNLTDLRQGERGVITRVGAAGAMRGRLLDLGLTEGATVTCAHRRARGDIAAYAIRGAVVALRAEDARRVEIGGVAP